MAADQDRVAVVERSEPPLDPIAEARLRRELEQTWYVPDGIVGWFSVVDHRTIGRRYIVTAFCFFIFAGLLAALMRIQLALPNNHFLGPDLYNQIFTTHGTMMMFLFAVPVMEAMGVYLVPLMVGARHLKIVATSSTATASPATSVNVIICAQKSERFPGV
jgi:heme/copper-type cytochrome/quinol oxidase subunit 1